MYSELHTGTGCIYRPRVTQTGENVKKVVPMDSMIEKLGLVFFGWLLGMLAPAVVDAIRQHRMDAKCRIAIRVELRRLALRLVFAVHGLLFDSGDMTDEELAWAKENMMRFSEGDESEKFIKSIQVLIETDPSIRRAGLQSLVKPGVAAGFQKYAVSVLDARVSTIHTFETTEQLQLLEIRTQIAFLDELVDRSKKLLDMSFTVTGTNHALVLQDSARCQLNYGKRAALIVDLIGKLPELKVSRFHTITTTFGSACRYLSRHMLGMLRRLALIRQ